MPTASAALVRTLEAHGVEHVFGVDFEGSTDYAAVAEAHGVAGFRVEAADEYEPTLAEAVALDGPAVVSVPVEPLPEADDVPVDWLEPQESGD